MSGPCPIIGVASAETLVDSISRTFNLRKVWRTRNRNPSSRLNNSTRTVFQSISPLWSMVG